MPRTSQKKRATKRAAQSNSALENAAKKTAAKKAPAKKSAAKTGSSDKPKSQADIIREGIARGTKRQTILKHLMEAAGKDEAWAKRRLALHEQKAGEYAREE